MFKPILAIGLLAQALPASATEENWIYLSASKSVDLYIDSNSIDEVATGRKTAWIKQLLRNAPEVTGIREISVLVEYDCPGRRTRFLKGTAIYENGRRETRHEVLEWSAVSTPLSHHGIQMDYVCSGEAPGPVAEAKPKPESRIVD